MKKIRLDITPLVAKYAIKYGAQYDKENGWYCFEPIPFELEEFVDVTERIKKQPSEKYIQCPNCGGQMHLRSSYAGRIFWRCMSYRSCNGQLSVNEAEDSNFKKVLKTVPDKNRNLVSDTHQNFSELAELGLMELGHKKAFETWLTKPKIALEGKRPIEVLNSDEGYNKVMDLLRKINQ